jgi:hypothetical protein
MPSSVVLLKKTLKEERQTLWSARDSKERQPIGSSA